MYLKLIADTLTLELPEILSKYFITEFLFKTIDKKNKS